MAQASYSGSGNKVLAELSQNPTARKNKYDELRRKFDALERHADFLATRLEATQKSGNQGAYNAILQQLQNAETRINSLATEMNSIAESSRYSAEQERKQQRIDARKPKTTMDKVRESLPYQIGSGIRDMIVDTGKGIGQTALYAENELRTGKAGTQLNPNTMQMEDIQFGDVADVYAKELAKNTGTYLDALNSMMHWRQGRLKPDSQDERFRKMLGERVPRVFGTKDIEDPTVAKGAEVIADPLALIPVAKGAVKSAKVTAKAIDEFGDIARGIRTADGQYIPRNQLGAIENLYHASPYSFDRFDLNKIGTGEGAQAYGHGGYLAEGKGTGLAYLKQFSKGNSTIGDKSIGELYAQMERKASKLPANKANAEYAKLEFLERLDQDVDFDTALSKIDDPNVIAWANSIRQEYKPDANLYKARLAWPDAREATDPLSPENFLDWDKPLSEQPNVLAKLSPENKQRISSGIDAFGNNKVTGQYLHDVVLLDDAFKERVPVNQARQYISNKLRNLDLAGVRYLDQGSRGTANGTLLGIINDGGKFKSRIKVSNRGGAQFQSPTDTITTSPPFSTELEAMEWANDKIQEGSHNYVVFDDKLIDIVERNGVPIKKAKK